MSTITTHVLDTSVGRPAQGVRVELEYGGALIGSGVTDDEGRVRDLLPADAQISEGAYRLTFFVGEYFSKASRSSFYNEIVINFRITSVSEHYHVPLLLSPFGYSTYRGS
ncbi:MAG TPA: hydroxyisourate hydrolase [Gemmatimonadaceae bacterium]|jgi:5-hydroxyisourate hydrolase